METYEVPSPLAMVAHRAEMARFEASRGRLRIAHLPDRATRFDVWRTYLAPVVQEYSRRTWGSAIHWSLEDAGPVAHLRLEDLVLRTRPPPRLCGEDGSGGGLFLHAGVPTVLEHQEHTTLQVPAGDWRVLRQRTVSSTGTARMVAD